MTRDDPRSATQVILLNFCITIVKIETEDISERIFFLESDFFESNGGFEKKKKGIESCGFKSRAKFMDSWLVDCYVLDHTLIR